MCGPMPSRLHGISMKEDAEQRRTRELARAQARAATQPTAVGRSHLYAWKLPNRLLWAD